MAGVTLEPASDADLIPVEIRGRVPVELQRPGRQHKLVNPQASRGNDFSRFKNIYTVYSSLCIGFYLERPEN